MKYLIALFLSCIAGFVTSVVLNKKVSKIATINFIVTGIFLFSIIIYKFYIVNFNGDINILVFLDENTYINGVYELGLFGKVVKVITNNFGIVSFRCLNIYLYFLSVTSLLNEINFNVTKNLKLLVISSSIILSSSLVSYWSFFVLKEAFTIAAISIILKGILNRKRKNIILGTILMFFIRMNYFLLILATIIITYVLKKGKKTFIIMLLIVLLGVIVFLSSDLSYKFKLGIIARRFGDTGMVYTGENASIASRNFFGFILSSQYIEVLVGNIKRSFWIFGNDSLNNIFSIMLVINNFILILINFIIKPKRDFILLFFVLTITSLMFTYCDYRYLNTILLPFTIYFFITKYDYNSKRECK